MVDKTFTEQDVARIICFHLDGDEQNRLKQMIIDDEFDCDFTFQDEADEDEKKKIRDINFEVEIDTGIWNSLVGFFAGFISSVEDEQELKDAQRAVEEQSTLDAVQRNLIVLRDLAQYVPRGRNRASYEKALLEIDEQSKILTPCRFISDKYSELKSEYNNLKEKSDSLTLKINELTSRVASWFL